MNVYLIQPNYRTGFKKNQSAWFPYSVGTCWSYAITNKQVADNHKLKDDVIKLQDHYTITPYQTYPIQLNLNYNLAEYITRDTNLKQEKTIYNLTLPDTKYLRHIHKEKHLDEWYAMLFYRNKTGWGKTFIKDDFNQYF